MQSCGWGIPYYKFEGHRRVLLDFSRGLEKKDMNFANEGDASTSNHDTDPNSNSSPDINTNLITNGDTKPETDPTAKGGMREWWRTMNARSIDGLPAVERAGWFAARLMGGVIPDAEVAGYKKRRTPEEAVEAARREQQNGHNNGIMGNGNGSAGGTKMLSGMGGLLDGVLNSNENGKLVLGVVIGFVASFVVSDLMSFGRRVFVLPGA